jgi:hypothetical protein
MGDSSTPASGVFLDEMTKKFRLVNPDEHHLAQNLLQLSEEIGEGEADFDLSSDGYIFP